MNDIEEVIADPANADLSPEMAAVFGYWNILRGTRFAPAWREFDWLALPTDFIPWCAVLDVATDPPDFIYRFFGTQRAQVQRQDFTGRSLRDVRPRSLSEKVWADNQVIVDSRAPKYFTTTQALDEAGLDTIAYHFLRLPFSDTGQTVNQVLSFGMMEADEIQRIHEYFDETAKTENS